MSFYSNYGKGEWSVFTESKKVIESETNIPYCKLRACVNEVKTNIKNIAAKIKLKILSFLTSQRLLWIFESEEQEIGRVDHLK